MTKEDVKNAILKALWTFEKSGYTPEELADEVNKILPWDIEIGRIRVNERNVEMLTDFIRDKQALAMEIGCAPIHNQMMSEVISLKKEASKCCAFSSLARFNTPLNK